MKLIPWLIETKEHEETDKKPRDVSEVRNQAESLIYSTNKSMKELDTKLSNQDKPNILDSINNLKKN